MNQDIIPIDEDSNGPQTFSVPGIGEVVVPRLFNSAPDFNEVIPVKITLAPVLNIIPVMNYIVDSANLPATIGENMGNIVATCIAGTLPGVGNILKQHGVLGDHGTHIEMPEEIDQQNVQTLRMGHCVRYVTLEALCTIVKPNTFSGREGDYIATRYRAFCAACKVPQATADFPVLGLDKWQDAVNACPDLFNTLCVYLEKNKETGRQQTALLDQIKLVWKGQGMTATNIMYKFVAETNSTAITKGPILSEAAQFKQAYESAKSKLGEFFDYGKIMKNPEVEALNHRIYPNLYTAALRNGRSLGLITQNMIVTANIGSCIPLDLLDRYLKEDMPPGARRMDTGVDFASNLIAIGVDPDIVTPREHREADTLTRLLSLIEGRAPLPSGSGHKRPGDISGGPSSKRQTK